MTIHKLSTNVKLGGNRPEAVELGSRVTVFWGPHGVGKTRIVQALSWLLTGVMDDTGRQDNQSSAAWEIDLHRPENATSTWAAIEGTKGAMRIDLPLNPKTGRPVQKATVTGGAYHPMAFPVREVAGWLKKSPDAAWTAFLPHIAFGVRGEAIAAQVGSVALEGVEEATKIRLAMPTTLDALVELRERSAKEAESAKSAVTRFTELAADARKTMGVVATTTEVTDLENRVTQMRARILEAQAAAGIPALQAKLQEMRALVERGETAIVQTYPHPGEPPKGVAYLDILTKGVALRAEAQAAGMPVCPVSGVTWAEARIDKLTAVTDSLRKSTQEWREAADRHNRARAKLADIKAEITNVERALAATRQEQAVAAETLAGWQKMLAEAEARLVNLKAARDSYERVQQYEEQAKIHKAVGGAWGTLNAATAAAVKNLLDTHLEKFIAKVQEAVPARYIVRIDTSIEGRAAFRPWLEDTKVGSGRASSGAQRAMVLLALTRVVMLTSSNVPPYAVLALPEERSIDGVTLGDLCRLWAKLDGPQVVFTSTEAPEGTMPPPVRVYGLTETGSEAPAKPTRRRSSKAAEVPEPPVASTTVAPAALAPAAAPAAPTDPTWGQDPTTDASIPVAPPPPAPTGRPEDAFLFGEGTPTVAPKDDDVGVDDGESAWEATWTGDAQEPDATVGAARLPTPDGGDPFAEPVAEPARPVVAPQDPAPSTTTPAVPEPPMAQDVAALGALLEGALGRIFGSPEA